MLAPLAATYRREGYRQAAHPLPPDADFSR